MVFGRRAFFGHFAHASGDVVWFVNVPEPAITPQERDRTTDDQWRQKLIALMHGDAGPAARLIEAGTLELAGDNTHDLGHVPTWHRDRMIVIGDAAHAPASSSGQGASMAAEDAVVPGPVPATCRTSTRRSRPTRPSGARESKRSSPSAPAAAAPSHRARSSSSCCARSSSTP